MIDFSSFYQVIAKSRLSHWLHTLPAQLYAWENSERHGNLPKWQRVLKKLTHYQSQHVNLKDKVEIGFVITSYSIHYTKLYEIRINHCG